MMFTERSIDVDQVDEYDEARPFPVVDLVTVALAGIPEPKRLFNGLFYVGALHSLAGPPDSGKTFIAYRAALQELREGNPVVVLDEENGREVVTEKLLDLGATPDELVRLAFVESPGRQWDAADWAGLAQLLDSTRPTLVIIDSVGAFMAVAGKDENVAADVSPFYKGLSDLARRYNPAVAVLDHVPKSEQASRYARGSGAKLQLVDVGYMVEAIHPFNRHQDGLLRLIVTKDRRGYLHRRHDVKVITEGGPLAFEISAVAELAASNPDAAGLPPATRKVLTILEDARPDTLTVAVIGDRLKAKFSHSLKPSTIREALNELARRHMADGEQGEGKEKRWWAASPDLS
jgi:hypothetical protein